MKNNNLCPFFYSEDSWQTTLQALLPLVHNVDQDATRIWFALWTPSLHQKLDQSEDLTHTIHMLEIEGRCWLKDQLESSLHFFFAFQYWDKVKTAVCYFAENLTSCDENLGAQIHKIVKTLSSDLKIPESHLIGITAVSLMSLQQVGLATFAEASPKISTKKTSPDQFLKAKIKKKNHLFSFLRTVDSKHTIVFNEHDKTCSFQAINGQDLSMASGINLQNYQSDDPRCSEGPIPFQCRTGTCGSCWIGVLRGKENLSAISEFEKERLHYFGYDFGIPKCESHPPIRLSCQAKCYGNVSIVIPPWNGVLNVIRSDR